MPRRLLSPSRFVTAAAIVPLALLSSACGGADGAGGPRPPREPFAARVVSGDGQSGVVAGELPAAVVVRIVDADGEAVTGHPVSFTPLGGGSVFAGAGVTNARGEAGERWTLGTRAGPQRLEVRAVDGSTGEALVLATFTAHARPGDAERLLRVGDEARHGVVDAAVAESLAVTSHDRYGNPVSGVRIDWSAARGGGTMSPASSVSDASGVARSQWTLGPMAWPDHLALAEAGSLGAVSFVARAEAGAAAGMSIAGIAGGTAGAGSSRTVAVRVVDARGNPVRDHVVTWAVASGGGSIDGASPSDADGFARATWTLGGVLGPQSVTAAASGVAATVTHTATVTPGAVSRMVFETQPSPTVVGRAVSPAVRLGFRDAFGHVVMDVGGAVYIALGPNPTGAYLGGEGRALVVDGVATFRNLTVDRAGSGYGLRAIWSRSVGGVAIEGSSAPFDVTGGGMESGTESGTESRDRSPRGADWW